MHSIIPKPQAFLRVLWTDVSITCHQLWMLRGPGSFQHRFQDGFISRRPSAEVHREDTQLPLTFTHA